MEMEQTKTPKLRFRQDDGTEFPAWEKKQFFDICQVNPKSPPLNDQFYYIDLDSVTDGKLNLKSPIRKEDAPSRAQRVVIKKDILFQLVRPYQMNHYLVNRSFDLQTVASTGFAQLRCENADSGFLYQILFTGKLNEDVLVRCTGTGYPAINSSDFAKIRIWIPALLEQQKIGDFFTSLDRRIDIADKKLATLQTIKKGMLQKIFSQELRFKDDDGNEFPAWEKKTLGDVIENMEYGLNAAAIPFDGKHKYIRITDIDDDTHQYLGTFPVSPDGDMIPERYRVHQGDILFARTGASVGKTYHYEPRDGELYFAGFLIRGHVKSSCNSYFIYLQTLTDKYKNWVTVTSMRTGQPGINSKEYQSFPVVTPSFPEQQKISAYFTAIDRSIAAAQKKAAALRTIKKGLLQKMFI